MSRAAEAVAELEAELAETRERLRWREMELTRLLKRRAPQTVRVLPDRDAVRELQAEAEVYRAQGAALYSALDTLWREYVALTHRCDQGYSCRLADEVRLALEGATGARVFLYTFRAFRQLYKVAKDYRHDVRVPLELRDIVEDIASGRFEEIL